MAALFMLDCCLLSQQTINRRCQLIELGLHEASCELHNASIAVDEHVACDARLTQGIVGKYISFFVEDHGVGGAQLGSVLLDHFARLFAVYTYEHKACVVFMGLPYAALDMGHLIAADATPTGGEL